MRKIISEIVKHGRRIVMNPSAVVFGMILFIISSALFGGFDNLGGFVIFYIPAMMFASSLLYGLFAISIAILEYYQKNDNKEEVKWIKSKLF